MSDIAPGEPTRATVIKWIRANLTVTMFIWGMVIGACSTLISVVKTWDDFTNHRHDQDNAIALLQREVDGIPESNIRGLRGDMVDVDRRFNENATNLMSLARARDQLMNSQAQHEADMDSDLLSRIRILEAKQGWIIERTPTPLPLGPRP